MGKMAENAYLTVRLNIAVYRKQLLENIASDQMSLKEFINQFTGEPVKKNKKK